MNDVMIDLETWGVGTNALVVSMGAIEFDLNTGKLGNTFYKNVNPVLSQLAGFVIDADTINWWLQQSPEAQEAFRHNRIGPTEAFARLAAFLQPGVRVWSNGSNFDIRILREGYKLLGVPCPWSFRDERDQRTFIDVMKRMEIEPLGIECAAVKHNALDDAEFQARLLIAYWEAAGYALHQPG